MKAELRLGLRLAGGGGAQDRFRAVTVVLAGLVGSWVLLTTSAIARTEAGRTGGHYSASELQLLLAAVFTTVAVPVVVLLATTARLSAALRDRRLACLRLLGLSPSGTRLVAAVESGAVAAVGSILGLVAFWALRPVASRVSIAGRDWSDSAFTPSLLGSAVIVLGLPLVAVVVALVPTARRSWAQRNQTSMSGSTRRPSALRLVPLVAGLVVTTAAASGQGADHVSDNRIYTFMGGAVLCGLGLLIVVPAFTRLLADLMVRLPGSPTVRIAGRRLQSQPAGVSRVVSGLLIGLFVVTGGRMVVGAFENTIQYRSAESAITDGPAAYNVIVPRAATRTYIVSALAELDGVRGAYLLRQVTIGCHRQGWCITGFVGTCAELHAASPDAVGCRNGTSAWLTAAPDDAASVPARAKIQAGLRRPDEAAVWVSMPRVGSVITAPADGPAARDAIEADVFIPSSSPGVLGVADRPGGTQIVVQADPGDLVANRITATVRKLAPKAMLYPGFSRSEYDFVAGLRAIVWAVAAVVLAIGLLGFAIATVDRAVSRRAEMVSLQLVGTSRRTIRLAQWWEALLPLLLGLPLAIAVGWSVGSGYLALADALEARPWQSVLALGATSLLASIAIAGLTVLACAPRIRADLIHRS